MFVKCRMQSSRRTGQVWETGGGNVAHSYLYEYVSKHGQKEGQGLAGPSLGYCDQVTTTHDRRNSWGLQKEREGGVSYSIEKVEVCEGIVGMR